MKSLRILNLKILPNKKTNFQNLNKYEKSSRTKSRDNLHRSFKQRVGRNYNISSTRRILTKSFDRNSVTVMDLMSSPGTKINQTDSDTQKVLQNMTTYSNFLNFTFQKQHPQTKQEKKLNYLLMMKR